jgi:hypothetical protein
MASIPQSACYSHPALTPKIELCDILTLKFPLIPQHEDLHDTHAPEPELSRPVRSYFAAQPFRRMGSMG